MDLHNWMVRENMVTSTLEIKKVINFRDLSLFTAGKTPGMKSGMLYRSGDLANATAKGKKKLVELGIRTVSDFRGKGSRDGSYHLGQGIRQLDFSIEAGGKDLSLQIKQYMQGEIEMDFEEFMLKLSVRFLSEFMPTFRRWIHNVLLDERSYPHVFHCTAGKDRTGFAAMLVLKILGIDDRLVIKDYLESNKHYEQNRSRIERKIGIFSPSQDDNKKLRPLFMVQEKYIQHSLDFINECWGSFHVFTKAKDGLDLTGENIQFLKELLLVAS